MKKIICTAVAMLLLFTTLCAVPVTVSADDLINVGVTGVVRYDYAQELLTLINRERAARGRNTMQMGTTLMADAVQRSAEIALYFNHQRPNGDAFYTVLQDDYGFAGEAFARAYKTPAEVLNAWLAEDPDNILRSGCDYIGISALDINGTIYWVAIVTRNGTYQPSTRNDKVTQTMEVQIKREWLTFSCPRETMTTCPLYCFEPYVLMNGLPVKAENGLTVTIADTNVAVLQGNTVFAKNAGTTTMTLTIGGFCTFNVPLTVQKDYCADLNGDGKVDSTDARLTLQYAVGKLNNQTLPNANRGDVNRDGNVDSTDARLILQYTVGKFTHFSENF